ncbi:MAG: hypothetical protein AAF050_24875 [Cyanobacteria bacterium J06649_5]
MVDQNAESYSFPVSQLLTHGAATGDRPKEWFDYVGHYKLGKDDVPMLLQLVDEGGSNNAQFEQDPIPLHACRALGQLGAGTAALALVKRLGDCSDALGESVLFALSMVGLPGLVALEGFFDSPDIDMWAQIRGAEGVAVFADRNPALRARCVAFLTQALSHSAQRQATVNGFLVYYLVELKATETSAVIEQAFQRNQVDEDVLGRWPDVQIQLGLAKVTDFSPELLLYAGELYPIPTVSELLLEQRLSDA